MGLIKRITYCKMKLDFMNVKVVFSKCAESSRIKPRYGIKSTQLKQCYIVAKN